MKIMLLTSSLNAGGAERVAVLLCNAFVARGDEVTLISTFSGGGECQYQVSKKVDLMFLGNLTRQHPHFLGNSYMRRYIMLRGFIKKKKPDVVISFITNVNITAILATAFLPCPVVFSERTDPFFDGRSKFWNSVCRMIYPFADACVLQTERLTQSINQLYPNIKKVHTIPNPLSDEIELCQADHKEKKRLKIISLGRLDQNKQVDKALSIFSSLMDDYPEWDFLIYGEGNRKNQLECLIESFGLNGRVFLMGSTSQPWQALSKADIFVMTSRLEGFPNALLEAMAVGLPCVVFDCSSGPKEITRNGLDAKLIPLNDMEVFSKELKELMSNNQLRIDLGRRARSSVLSRYKLTNIISLWDDLFKSIKIKKITT